MPGARPVRMGVRATPRDEPVTELAIERFVDLADGGRVSLGPTGAVHAVVADASRREVEEQLRSSQADWPALIDALAAAGVTTDEDALRALPFLVEFDDDVRAELVRPASEE